MPRTVRISRQNLSECPSCRRHVRVEPRAWRDAACAFCGAKLREAAARDPLAVVRELAGGASGTMAAALLGLGLAGCSAEDLTDPLPALDTGTADGGPVDLGMSPADVGFTDARVDAGAPPAPLYGGPPPDAGAADAGAADATALDASAADASAPDAEPEDGGALEDAGAEPTPDVGGPAPLYGVPPPPEDAGARPDAEVADAFVVADGAVPQPHYGVVPPRDAGEPDGGR